MLNKTLYIIAACILCLQAGAFAQSEEVPGTLSYSLPQTVLRIEVSARIERFHAGPYARYAMKYLGVKADEEDRNTASVSHLRLLSFTEADASCRYVVTPGTGAANFMALTAQGLVSLGGGTDPDTEWTFTKDRKSNFSDKGVGSNLTSESTMLYRNVKDNSSFNMVAVRQEMVVEKSLETRAKEAADMIFRLRDKKLQIVTGDTDASYSGEAMGAAIKEIDRLQKEYLELFLGYSDAQTQKMNFDIVPAPNGNNEKHKYVAFRVSDAEGIVQADNVAGRPYILEIEPQVPAAPQNQAKPAKGNIVYYRIPAVCNVRIIEGGKALLHSRMPVYQLGIISNYNISNK